MADWEAELRDRVRRGEMRMPNGSKVLPREYEALVVAEMRRKKQEREEEWRQEDDAVIRNALHTAETLFNEGGRGGFNTLTVGSVLRISPEVAICTLPLP